MKSLCAAFPINKYKAALIRLAMRHELTDTGLPEGTKRWIRQCHNRPRPPEVAMHAINEFLEGFGVESLELADNQKWVDKYYMWSRASYVNMGDTYAATILRDNKTGSYTIKSWGDFVEAQSKKVRFK